MISLDRAALGSPLRPRRPSRTRGFCVLAFLCLGCLLQGACDSHLTSFFDLYATKEKGLSSTQSGIILASYCFVMVCLSPLIAKLITSAYFQDRTLLLIAWTVDAVFGVIISSTNKLGRGYPFFFGFLTLRVLEGTGCALGYTVPYVIAGVELNDQVHIVIPLLETIDGISVSIGPALSGVLYDLGGFPAPFLGLGGLLLLLMILAMFFLPEARLPSQHCQAAIQQTEGNNSNIWAALKFPVLVNVLCTISSYTLLTANDSTLARRLNDEFGMNASESGLIFLYPGAFYGLSSMVAGYVSRKIPDPRLLVISGQLVSLVALALQGPLIPIAQTKTVFVFAQILLGIGAGPSLACSYLHSLKYLSKGQETRDIHAMLSAIFVPASLIGGFVGPLAAGIIRQCCSYEAVVAANALHIMLIAILLFVTIRTEKEAKLSSINLTELS